MKDDLEACRQIQESNLLKNWRDQNRIANELNRLHTTQLDLLIEGIRIERWFIDNELQIPKRRK